jgi:uncharacterized membrane protein
MSKLPQKSNFKKYINRYFLGAFYTLAGILHFIMPEFYQPLMPDYIPVPELMNVFAGLTEILLGLWILSGRLPRLSAMFGTLMLLAFIPAHIHFIDIGGCLPGELGLCVPMWVAWARLIIIHPILILWLWARRA